MDDLELRFCAAFGLTIDRRRLAQRFFTKFCYLMDNPSLAGFDHVTFYQHGENLVFVSQPYDLNEEKLKGWAEKNGAIYTRADEWGFYYPGHALLFILEFPPELVKSIKADAYNIYRTPAKHTLRWDR